MKGIGKFILTIVTAALMTPVMTSCGSTGHIDYIYKDEARLDSNIVYADRDFLDEGIGAVTLKTAVDGDTAHFNSVKSGRLVKVRFMGIDTPESTGQIEPWGKKASAFTTGKLESAKTIVLSKEPGEIGTAAEADSTGTRFKAYVWVSETANCPVNELINLNLWVVQEGYSNAKGMASSVFTNVFQAADLQAQSEALHIWDPNGDPDFYKGSATVTSLKELSVDTFSLDDPDESKWNGKKVYVEGIVAKVVGTDCYINLDFENEETGELERYGLFIFSGYKSYEPLLTVGNYISAIGSYTIRYGNPQMTDVAYNKYLPGENDIVLISKGNTIEPLESTISDLVDDDYALNDIVTLSNLKGTGGYDEIDATTEKASGAMSIYCTDEAGNEITFRVPSDVWVIDRTKGGSTDRVSTYTYFCVEGETFNITGALEKYESASGRISYQVKLCNKVDVSFND